MPIYDYSCTSCGHLTEVIHGINDDGPRFCPSCGAEGTMKKGFSTPAVHFKGSGWARKERSSGSSSTKAAAKEAAGGTSNGSTGEASASTPGSRTDSTDSKD